MKDLVGMAMVGLIESECGAAEWFESTGGLGVGSFAFGCGLDVRQEEEVQSSLLLPFELVVKVCQGQCKMMQCS